MPQTSRHVGYIRTSVYSKVIPMLRPDRISHLEAHRGTVKSTRKETIRYLTRVMNSQSRYTLDWKRGEEGPFPERVVNRLISEYKLSDLVVGEVTVVLKSPAIIERLNLELRYRYSTKGGPQVYLPTNCSVLATFRNNPGYEAVNLRYVADLNAESREKLSCPIGVLDLVDLKTERTLTYGEREEWPVDEGSLVRPVLKALDFEGWPAAERVVMENGIATNPRPVAIREYTRGKSEGWKLVTDEEEWNGDL